ncbi:hypothetical protein VZO05_02775 [Aggregatilineales bacterium SYSU G02658]
MDLSFLTPEVFNVIIMVNLIVGVVLVVWRFTSDMRQPLNPPQSHPDDAEPPARPQS